MLYLGCHMVDLIYNFMGVPDRIIPFNKKSGLDGLDYIDNACAVFEYERGVGIACASAVEVNGVGRRQLVVAGSRETIEIKPIESPTVMKICNISEAATYVDKARTEIATPDPATFRYDEMMIDFAAFVRGEKKNQYTLEYEYQLQKMILAACGEDIDYKKTEEL